MLCAKISLSVDFGLCASSQITIQKISPSGVFGFGSSALNKDLQFEKEIREQCERERESLSQKLDDCKKTETEFSKCTDENMMIQSEKDDLAQMIGRYKEDISSHEKQLKEKNQEVLNCGNERIDCELRAQNHENVIEGLENKLSEKNSKLSTLQEQLSQRIECPACETSCKPCKPCETSKSQSCEKANENLVELKYFIQEHVKSSINDVLPHESERIISALKSTIRNERSQGQQRYLEEPFEFIYDSIYRICCVVITLCTIVLTYISYSCVKIYQSNRGAAFQYEHRVQNSSRNNDTDDNKWDDDEGNTSIEDTASEIISQKGEENSAMKSNSTAKTGSNEDTCEDVENSEEIISTTEQEEKKTVENKSVEETADTTTAERPPATLQ
ncbi:uncharacterized protein LOC141903452 [Tubulanus polymorphus]|uniref:uncharacterized protein LOC141903452 n=1 Tax=Tubulanus polymorphus TaxID=672921 RepID=UPI003DA5AEE6